MIFEPMRINLSELKINSADQSSRISLGSTVIKGINVAAKKSQAFGQHLSDSSVQINPVGATNDNDFLDAASDKMNFKKG